MYEDLCSKSSEKYWRSEGNNKRMRFYHKLSKILKITRNILFISLALYCVILATNSIFCLYDKFACCDNEISILNLIDFKNFILDIYVATFIIALFVVLYFSRNQKYSIKQIICIIMNNLLFLPVSSLLVYNFVVLGSLMSSFYLLVVFVVLNLIINQLTNRIDKLYDIAVGNIEMNRKGDKKVCKGR